MSTDPCPDTDQYSRGDSHLRSSASVSVGASSGMKWPLGIERPDNLAIDQLSFTIASDQVGVFELEASVGSIVAGNATLRMDDLLEAQYANQTHVGMLDGAIQFHLQPLIRFINKKFYT